MTSPHSEEQLLRDWMTETVWLPDSDLSGVQARIHRTPQHRGLLPPVDLGGLVRMFSATKLFVAGVVVVLFGGLLMAGLLPGSDEPPPAPGVVAPTTMPEDTLPPVAAPTEEPTPTEPAVIATAEPATTKSGAALKPKNVHWEGGGISFDASSIKIMANGRTFKPNELKWLQMGYSGSRVDGIPPEATIEAHWKDDGTPMRLRLELRSDGKHWWVQRVRTFDGTDDGDLVGYTIDKDLTLTKLGDLMRASINYARPGRSIYLEGLRIDAFRPGTIPEWSPKPKNPRLKIEIESKTMLPGQRQRLTAEWCLEDDCWPATDARWSSDTPGVISFAPSSGSWTEVTALGTGYGYITGRVGLQGHSRVLWVYPRPGKKLVPDAVSPRRIDVASPVEEVLRVGQHVVVTGWRCATKDEDQLGRDGRPGTEDDACRTRDIGGVRSVGESGLVRLGVFGPSALLRVDTFKGIDGPLHADPIRVDFPDRKPQQLATSHLYVRDAEWAGPYLGDFDDSGVVDAVDSGLLAATIEEHGPRVVQGDPGWRRVLDLNSDQGIDSVDLLIAAVLVHSHAGESMAEPVPDEWGRRAEISRNEEFPGRTWPSPTVKPTTTPTKTEPPEDSAGIFMVASGQLGGSVRTAAKPERVHWSDRGVTFDARDFTITTRYGTFKPKTPHSIFGYHDFYSTTDNGVPREAELEADWKQDGAWMRLRFELRSDGEDWWIHRIRTYDGHPSDGQYLNYPNLKEKTLTKMGEAFEGSLNIRPTKSERMSSVPGARLVIKDMRLEAYDLEAIPTPEPRVERPRLVIENELSALLSGQSMRVTARWCLQDDCWPARDVRWSTDRPDSTKIDPERGSWTRVTALKPGEASIQADAHQIGYGGGVLIHPRPGKGTDEQRYGKRKHAKKVVVTPRDQVLKLGQYAVLTGWRCPTKGPGQLGPDGEAGTKDDKCVTEAPASWRPLPNSGIATVGEFGPSALILADSFELEGDDLMYAPVFARFEGHDISEPNLYIRDAVVRGPLLGDLDADDAVDADDLVLLAAVLDEHGLGVERNADGWDAALDLNHDGRVDDVDQDLLVALVGAHAGTIEPVPAQPFATMPPDVGHAP